MIVIFIALIVTLGLMWLGKKKPAVIAFIISYVLGLGWFVYHVSTRLNIQL